MSRDPATAFTERGTASDEASGYDPLLGGASDRGDVFKVSVVMEHGQPGADLRRPGPPPPTAERIAARQLAYAAAPADRFPRIAAAATTMASYISNEQYLWGLHRLLDGLSAVSVYDSRP